MVQKSRTKDESFMLVLYDLAIKSGQIDSPFDRYEVGNLAAMNKKATDTICKQLLRTNFIKIGDDENLVYLTQNGIRLVEGLHESL